MQQTETYKLNLIDRDDTFSPAALNENAETLEAELARLDAGLGSIGTNCRIESGSYVGTGTAGSAYKANVLQFDRLPTLLFVSGDQHLGVFLRGSSTGFSLTNLYAVRQLTVIWGADGKLSWYYSSNFSASQLNTEGVTYVYTALYA